MIKALLTLVLGWSLATWAHNDHAVSSPLKAHLRYKNKTLHIHAQMAQLPVVGQESFLMLEARAAEDHSPTDIADQIEVSLWMPGMNHGSAPTQLTRVMDAQGKAMVGQYIVRNMYFVMGGLWEIRITLTDSKGHQETGTFTIQLPESGHHH